MFLVLNLQIGSYGLEVLSFQYLESQNLVRFGEFFMRYDCRKPKAILLRELTISHKFIVFYCESIFLSTAMSNQINLDHNM